MFNVQHHTLYSDTSVVLVDEYPCATFWLFVLNKNIPNTTHNSYSGYDQYIEIYSTFMEDE